MDKSESPGLGSRVSSAGVKQQFITQENTRKFAHVLLPRLSEAEKSLYENFIPELDASIKVDEVVGEIEDDFKGPLYYGRYAGGIIMGFPAGPFAQRYPELIKEYEAKKKTGSLASFDPSGHDVHPKWRIKFHLTINKRERRASVSASSAHGSQFDESQSASDEPSDYLYSEDARAHPTRRSTRHKTNTSALPFSPKKTRSTMVYPIPDTDEESDAPLVQRRSRRLKPTQIPLEEDASDESESDEYPTRKSRSRTAKGKGNGRKNYEGAPPAYGLFRSVNEFEEDADPDTKELRKHWRMCGKCHRGPAHISLAKEMKRSKKGKRRRKGSHDDLDEEEDEVERLKSMGGWVQCLKCPVSVHWSCLSRVDQGEILKAARERERTQWLKEHEGRELDIEEDGPRKRPGLDITQMTAFICSYCAKDGMCMGCSKTILAQSSQPKQQPPGGNATDGDGDVQMQAASSSVVARSDSTSTDARLLFRCFTCKRLAHYQHIEDDISPDTSDYDLADIAAHYQSNWLCKDCVSYLWSVDKILAWRPYPTNATQPLELNTKEPLPREYLIKWQERGYRRTEWVPHMWLVSTHFARLKNFLVNGTKAELLDQAPVDQPREEEPTDIFGNIATESSAKSPKADNNMLSSLSGLVDAEDRIPIAWKTVGRVLDVQLRFDPKTHAKANKRKNSRQKRGRKSTRIDSEDEEEVSESEEAKEAFEAAFDRGEEPQGLVESVEDFEERTGTKFDPEEHIGLVIWAFFKWNDLGYEESTWDAPPRATDPTYPAFQDALIRFSVARKVEIQRLTGQKLKHFLNRTKGEKRALKSAEELDLGQDSKLRLMPFQVEGFNWLFKNWWNQQPCILADEMGLGKTVQIASFIGHLKQYEALPALVVVPNSTITNWVREFERWAPNLRVVPFYGEAKARDIVKRFELRHAYPAKDTTGAKFHVLVTTYEALINPKDFGTIFKSEPRWEVLVIDEGQRLKNDNSLLFRKLNELTTGHRIIMTGTPLNNNIRELFNLMNFLDPAEWNDLVALEKQYEELDEELVKDLHNKLRPYFLRRIKSEVLDLPPKNEVIVPVSMTTLQKEVYRSILSHNVELLQSLMQPSGLNTGPRKAIASVNNLLMQLRKVLQHPYLYDEDIEPRGLPVEETHEKLISASAKLRLLKDLLPKLKARGHRVLIFSQFVIALNIIEDFLAGEGHKFLRLDGNTKGTDRQKGMDEFNRPDSDIFIYLLTTRAGGVGINLFTADTVIIFDPDFNPHQDLQAIARSHRYGQKKTCLVFKLMVKDSAEERIIQIGKKKLVLDHLIVQKMDDDESAGENVQSILTYGAQQLFAEEAAEKSKDIVYSETDIDNLITKTETEGDEETAPKEGASFSFARIWTADKEELEDVVDNNQFEVDSWAQTLQKINEERTKKQAQEEEESGKGGRRNARRKATNVINYALHFESPKKKSRSSDGDSVFDSEHISDASDTSEADDDIVDKELEELTKSNKKGKSKAATPTECGLCGLNHPPGPGNCAMTDSSENLVEYRQMLIMHTQDESYEQRCAAVNSIDEVLRRRGHQHMIVGQALYPVRPPRAVPPLTTARKLKSSTSTPSAPVPSISVLKVPQSTTEIPIVQYTAPVSSMTAPAVPRHTLPKVKAQNAFNHSMSSHVASSAVKMNGAGPSNLKATVPHAVYTTAPYPQPSVVSASNGASIPVRLQTGTGKRQTSPSPSEPSSKRSKQLDLTPDTCCVCNQRPAHILKECSVVQGDLSNLFKVVERLKADSTTATVGQKLYKYALQRQKEANTVAL
ncbi:hypothetical protein BDP27DRAFT_1313905 [Rhodocollybia butyracea]|uniref:Chromatin remodeling factor mit1 n=1 Tax=Rhodocollybia butyracea TaxID=206335 RepID=A0A9P5Q795_9AGAR|nr:hypothetical protein BDP27DRAFT_1313905 [Rhodocollybia butyracea]